MTASTDLAMTYEETRQFKISLCKAFGLDPNRVVSLALRMDATGFPSLDVVTMEAAPAIAGGVMEVLTRYEITAHKVAEDIKPGEPA